MNERDAFEQVLDDLRELVRQHPEVKSLLLRLLRAVRDAVADFSER
jgi:hypothetical protein